MHFVCLACCQDYAVSHFLRLLQSFQSLIISSCSWSIWTVYCLRQPSSSRFGPTKTQCWLKRKICAPWLAFSRVKVRSAAELEEGRVECAGWLCTLGCRSGCSTFRKRASNLGTVGIHPGIARMKSLARSHLWLASMDADQEAKVQTCTKRQ